MVKALIAKTMHSNEKKRKTGKLARASAWELDVNEQRQEVEVEDASSIKNKSRSPRHERTVTVIMCLLYG